jgi:hypothetical protein
MNVTKKEFYLALFIVWMFIMFLMGRTLQGARWSDYGLFIFAFGWMLYYGIMSIRLSRLG